MAKKKLKCEICGKKFDGRWALAGHMNAHRKKKDKKKIKEKIRRIKIGVVGIGGGGNSMVADIASSMRRVRFISANTDARALKKLTSKKKIKMFQFGEDLTGGMGTGMNPKLGEKAAKAEKKRIEKLLKGQDLCIFLSCLGGGTSSGATPIFAKISNKLGNTNFGIFTLPFKFEGKKKAEIARNALKRSKPYLQAFSVIPNERIFKIVDKKTPLKKALSAINERLTEALKGLIEMIKRQGLINIDFTDLKTILDQRKKLAFLNKVKFKQGKKEDIGKLIFSPLYSYNIKGARGLLFNLVGGNKLSLGTVNEISSGLLKLMGRRAKIIFGIKQKRNFKDKIALTLLATGCKTKEKILPKAKEKKSKRKTKKAKTRAEKKSVTEASVQKEMKSGKEKERVRRTALQIKRELEREEKERLEKEKIWEIPAILRKKQKT